MSVSASPVGAPVPAIPEAVLRQFLPRQRWYAGTSEPSTVEVVHAEVLRDGWPKLVRLLVAADGSCYQVVIGLRPDGEQLDFLRGHETAALGSVDLEGGERATAYDAAFDPDLGLHLYWHVTGGDESAERVRAMGVEQSNTSLVYDERVVLKLFRKVLPGPNPEIEVTSGLARVGFPWVAEPLATETIDLGGGVRYDVALVQPFLAGATDGWALALTSLRDLFGVYDTQSIPVINVDGPPPTSTDPAEAGGDFASEAFRLGETTAAMHIGLAEAFGRDEGDPAAWADDIEAQARRSLGDVVPALAILDDLRQAAPGPAIRSHGDYHLGQVMRTDAGWYVLDFEGEPDRPLEERQRRTSPLRDVAGMLRSLHYASAVAAAERDTANYGDCGPPALSWEARNRRAFLDGYLPAAAEGGILPADQASVDALLAAFELEKAVYELAYERSHRPEWEHIPLTALRRLGVDAR